MGRGEGWLVWGLAAAGVALRLRQYAGGRSLWLDEATLAEGVSGRSLVALLTEPLPDKQVAPLGFVAALHVSLEMLGRNEYAARLPSLLAGVAVVLLAVWVARRLFQSAAARACLVGLTAGAPALIYYSAEAKQYGLDALVTLVMLGLAVTPAPTGLVLGLAGVLAPWLSHTAPFALAAAGAVRGAVAVRSRRWSDLWRLGVVAVAWLASVAVASLLTLESVRGNQTMARYWRGAFAPSPLDPLAGDWYGRAMGDIVAMAFQRAGPLELAPALWWPSWLDLGVPLAAALGLAALCRRRPPAGIYVLLVLGGAGVASGAGRYPLAGRLVLFAAPLLFVCLAALVEALAVRPRWWVRTAGWVLAVGWVVLVAGPAAAIARRPLGGSDVKGALAYVQTQALTGDRLAVSAWSAPAVRFYQARFGLDRLRPAPLVPPSFDAAVFLAEARRTRTNGRVWIVLSHRYRERGPFLAAVGREARLVEAWEGDGAGAFLFEVPR
jgi:hypothetical protein